MCLIVNPEYKVPEDGTIRYKFFEFDGKTLWSPYQGRTTWEIGVTKEVRNTDPDNIDSQGYHVFIDDGDARQYQWPRDRLFKVRCEGFVAGGVWEDDKKIQQEIWRKVTIVEKVN